MSTNKYEPLWIETKDEKGQLASMGLSWFERRPKLGRLLITITMMCAAGFVFALIGAMVKWPDAGPWLIFTAVGAVGSFWGAVHYQGPNVPRSVIFERGGRIRTPYGISHADHFVALGMPHTEIQSIETRLLREFGEPQDDYFGVRLVAKQGNTVAVTHDLQEDEALMIAVRLSNALKAIREAAMVDEIQKMFRDPDDDAEAA